ncbi:hypothetical protein F4803DRAFT_567400 [Xylaria telfairii]|nr:hypothetical protein F4803DRAFT_567400 [Xylaria telfairii]
MPSAIPPTTSNDDLGIIEKLLQYFQYVDKKWNLSKDITFGDRVTKASFGLDEKKSLVYINNGAVAKAQYLLPAMGFASKIYIPPLKGLENFKGSGNRIGVIGTGATGVQIIQELGPTARSMVVFPRSPNFALPMRKKELATKDVNKHDYLKLFQVMRDSISGTNHIAVGRGSMTDTHEQREALYEQLWAAGGVAPTQANYGDLMTNIGINTTFYNFWGDGVRQRITKNDPELTFYEKKPIMEVKDNGIKMVDGEFHELDVLILAPGFDPVTGSFSRGSRTTLGMTTSGFPNMFYLYGPQNPIASASGPVLSEIQSDFIIRTLLHTRKSGKTTIDAKKEGNIPGKARESPFFMGGLAAYREALNICIANEWLSFEHA